MPTAVALNCSLKASNEKEKSLTDKVLADLLSALKCHGVTGETVRALDHDIKPGVLSDMGKGDDWPALGRKILAADIFILGTPIWLGQPSSVAKRVMERMDAFRDRRHWPHAKGRHHVGDFFKPSALEPRRPLGREAGLTWPTE